MKPPRLARALVRLLADPDDRTFLLDDLDRRFRELADTRGKRAARRWYWAQALSCVPAALTPDLEMLRRRSWAGVLGDLRLAVRAFRRKPLFAAGVSGTLGLGLAAALITFAVAWRVWLAPLPIPEPDRVVRLYEIAPPDAAGTGADASAEARRHQFSDALVVDFHGRSWETIEELGFVMGRVHASQLAVDGGAYTVSSLSMPPEAYRILEIVPSLGRLPIEAESEVLLTEGFWRSAFGADPSIIGSRMQDPGSGFSTEVVGVAHLPSGYPGDVDLLYAFDWRIQAGRSLRWYEVFARLRPDGTVAAAEAEMNAFMASLAEIHPEHRGWTIEAVPLAADLVAPFRGVIVLLLAAGIVFLLLAGVNVLGLVAARHVESERDRSIRLALGASEGRLLGGSLVEGLALALVGTIAGVAGAYWLIPPIRAMVPQEVPRLTEVALTYPLAVGAVVVGLGLGAAVGLGGYLLSRGSGHMGRPMHRSKARGAMGRHAIVVGQVALTTLLTAGAAAVLHRVTALRAVDLGFDAEGLSVTTGDLGAATDVPTAPIVRALVDRLEQRGLPAAVAFNTPMSLAFGTDDGFPPFPILAEATAEEVFYELHPVTHEYFSVMGIQVIGGRPFRFTDDASSQKVVIVSKDFVEQYFGPATPLDQVVGRTIGPVMLMGGPSTIVGVTQATRHAGPDQPSMPSVYIPFAQQVTIAVASLLVQGTSDDLGAAVTEVLGEVAPDGRWSPLIPYASYVSEWYAPFRFQLLMVGVLAALGLLLASLGLYSLMAYQVAMERRELGIRKALGARDGRLLLGVFTRGLAMTLAGAVVGLGAWYGLLPAARGLLDGIESAGWTVLLAVTLVVGGSCLIATVGPALRATRVDVAVTLKSD